MGMKVAAVSLMCQDKRVFQAMEMAGTPCPYEGAIGQEAASKWDENAHERPDFKEYEQKMEERNEQVAMKLILEGKNEALKEKQWIRACKKTSHLAGKHKGIRKSGSTCRKEWALQTSSAS